MKSPFVNWSASAFCSLGNQCKCSSAPWVWSWTANSIRKTQSTNFAVSNLLPTAVFPRLSAGWTPGPKLLTWRHPKTNSLLPAAPEMRLHGRSLQLRKPMGHRLKRSANHLHFSLSALFSAHPPIHTSSPSARHPYGKVPPPHQSPSPLVATGQSVEWPLPGMQRWAWQILAKF